MDRKHLHIFAIFFEDIDREEAGELCLVATGNFSFEVFVPSFSPLVCELTYANNVHMNNQLHNCNGVQK